MALRGLILAAAIVTTLAWVAVGEEPANDSLAAPAPAPVSIGEGQGAFGWTDCYPLPPIGPFGVVAILLAVTAAIVFVVGLFQKRHDYKPLVLGLFSLGMGFFQGGLNFLGSCTSIVSGKPYVSDYFYAMYVAAWPAVWGLGSVIIGGLFTVILHWRNERFRAEGAAAVEVEEEVDAPKEAGK